MFALTNVFTPIFCTEMLLLVPVSNSIMLLISLMLFNKLEQTFYLIISNSFLMEHFLKFRHSLNHHHEQQNFIMFIFICMLLTPLTDDLNYMAKCE